MRLRRLFRLTYRQRDECDSVGNIGYKIPIYLLKFFSKIMMERFTRVALPITIALDTYFIEDVP